ncbi:hypothetical protein Bbelb_076600 [Branchiostoma belcheri]|nr:hypothetical protein Bbelb_076600 [Branchiostoma belcheri]
MDWEWGGQEVGTKLFILWVQEGQMRDRRYWKRRLWLPGATCFHEEDGVLSSALWRRAGGTGEIINPPRSADRPSTTLRLRTFDLKQNRRGRPRIFNGQN